MKYLKLTILLLLSVSIYAQNATKTKYYRHLRYNHVSPYIQLSGTYPIDKSTAESTSHYMFIYDSNNRLVEIINNHYFTERSHPLASIGAYRTLFTYEGNQETRIYYDKNGIRITNDRTVFKEVFSKDKKGNYTKLEFFDVESIPMESNWGTSEYQWSKKRNMVIEKRFNLKGEPRDLSSYFEFKTTGMLFRKDGSPIGHYNLNEDLEIANNSIGIASYQDTYDESGNHVKYTYHDENDDFVMNQYGFSIGIKKYDFIGNYIQQEHYDPNMTFLRSRDIASSQHVVSFPFFRANQK